MPIVTVPSRGVKAEDYFTSDRRLYLDAEGGVVEVDNKSRKTLLVGKNGQIPMARARELGLVEGEAPSGAEVSTSAAEPSTPETREAAKPEGESQAKSSKKTASKKSK